MKIPSNIKATLKTDFKFSTTSNNHIYLIQCAVLDCIHYTFYVKYNNRLNADLSVIKYIHNSFLAKDHLYNTYLALSNYQLDSPRHLYQSREKCNIKVRSLHTLFIFKQLL